MTQCGVGWNADAQTIAFFTIVFPLIFYVYWRFTNRRLLQLASRIPGPPGLPFLGNLLEFYGSPTDIFENIVSKSYMYEDVIKLWFGPRLCVFLTHPADIEVLLSSNEHIEKSVEYNFMKPWLGEGLLTSSGQKWFSHRKVIAQCFHLNVLRSFLDKFNQNAAKTVLRLSQESGNEFDCRKYLCQFTAETLLETVMGVDKEKIEFKCPVYSAATTKICRIMHLRHTKLYFRPDIFFNYSKYGFELKKVLNIIHRFSHEVMKYKKHQKEINSCDVHEMLHNLNKKDKSPVFDEIKTGISYGQSSELKDDLDSELLGGKKRSAFLDTLLEKERNKEIFTEKDVLDQIDTVMFEGHDTTAGVSSMFLCIMATNPDIQAKCVEELDKIFGDSDRDVTFQDTLEMKYLERCIMETMRLYSPVPIIARNLKKELKLVSKNLILPVGTTVVVGIFKLHRRADLFPNPERFNPDNFLFQNTASRNYYSFIPFSAGPRSCVGRKYAILKLKTILSTILRKYHITTSCPPEKWKLQADITLKRTDGFKIKLALRNNKTSANDIFENLYSKSSTYPDVGKVWVGPRLLVFLSHPADIEIVLSSHEHLDKSDEYDFLRPWLGNGLLVSSGNKWRSHRKIIAPTFHLNVLRSFMERFNRNAKKTLERLDLEENQEIDIHDYMSECTVEILIETVMGVQNEGEGRNCFEYAKAVMKMCDILHLRQTKFYLRPDLVFYNSKYGSEQKNLLSVIHGLTKKVLHVKKAQFDNKTQDKFQETLEKEDIKVASDTNEGFSYGQASGLKDDLDVEEIGGKKRSAFLESMIERAANHDSINDEEVKEQLDTIMFEGHDTTAAASSFFLCMMAAHPEIQEKCYDEIMRTLGDSDRDITFQDVVEMKYLERCLMETLRMYPPVPIIARKSKKEIKLASKDLIIPANCTVIIAIFKLHRRQDIYPNPDKFDPDNFLPEKSASRHYYSFIPFSAGPRSCVGRKYAMLKLKTILAYVLKTYRVKPGYSEEEWKLQADIILKRADGFRIQLERRSKKTL